MCDTEIICQKICILLKRQLFSVLVITFTVSALFARCIATAGLDPFHRRKYTGVAHHINYGGFTFRYGSAPVQTQLVKSIYIDHAGAAMDINKTNLVLKRQEQGVTLPVFSTSTCFLCQEPSKATLLAKL